jgi:hypothetical protein
MPTSPTGRLRRAVAAPATAITAKPAAAPGESTFPSSAARKAAGAAAVVKDNRVMTSAAPAGRDNNAIAELTRPNAHV